MIEMGFHQQKGLVLPRMPFKIEDIGPLLREHRKDRPDIKQSDVAISMGVSQSVLSKWEKIPHLILDNDPDFIERLFLAYGFTKSQSVDMTRDMLKEKYMPILKYLGYA